MHTCDTGLPDEETQSSQIDFYLTGAVMFGTSRQVFVYNKTKETFLAFRVDVADSIAGRLIGLLGRKSLRPDSGVWIFPANAVHTIGMLFSFDVVMIDKDFKVVSVKELVQPFRVILPKPRAESVIELPAHTIFRSRTEIGDELVIDRYEARKISQQEFAETKKMNGSMCLTQGHFFLR